MAVQRTVHRRGLALLSLSRNALVLATIVLAAADWGSRRAGDTVFPGGPLDEVAHLMTTLLVVWALGPRACKRYLVAALIASVLIDADHVPDRLGYRWLTAAQRPYSHSLLTTVVVLAIALLWRRRRDVWVGIALGLAIHFWRDLGEGGGGVALLWPISYHSFRYPHSVYLAVMGVIVLIDLGRCTRGRRSIDSSVIPLERQAPPADLVSTAEEA